MYFGQKSKEHVKTIKSVVVVTKTTIFMKNRFLSSHIFFYSFNVFFRFLAEIRLRTIMKLPQKQILEQHRAVFVPLSPCLKEQSADWFLDRDDLKNSKDFHSKGRGEEQ